ARKMLQEPHDRSPLALIRAAEIRFHAARTFPQNEAAKVFQQLIPVLESTLTRLEASDEGGLDLSPYLMAVGLLAFSYELLGETPRAVDSLTRGLRADPTNSELLGSRGMLLYGTSPEALTDLELAVKYGAREIWPYFFLAHHCLISGRFDQCLAICQRAS